MATANFIRTKSVDLSDKMYSIAIIDLNGVEVEHPFWYSCISTYGKENTKKILCARVLYENGFQQDAHDLLSPEAIGSIFTDENGNLIDNRSWQKIWIDSNPISPVLIELNKDPLL